jgi:hypothetical protein
MRLVPMLDKDGERIVINANFVAFIGPIRALEKVGGFLTGRDGEVIANRTRVVLLDGTKYVVSGNVPEVWKALVNSTTEDWYKVIGEK